MACDRGRPRQHVQALRERDGRHEGQRGDAVQPPHGQPSLVRGLTGETGVLQALPEQPAERRPALEGAGSGRVAQPLEHEPRERQEEQRSDEDPVSGRIPALLFRVAQARGTNERAAAGEDEEPGDEREPEGVEEERVAEVEGAVPEADPQRLGHVVVESQDDRAREEHEEAVEDRGVREPGDACPAPDPGMRQRHARRAREARAEWRSRRARSAAPAASPAQHPCNAPEEDRRGNGGERVPDDEAGRTEAGERGARLFHLSSAGPDLGERFGEIEHVDAGAIVRRPRRSPPTDRCSRR